MYCVIVWFSASFIILADALILLIARDWVLECDRQFTLGDAKDVTGLFKYDRDKL